MTKYGSAEDLFDQLRQFDAWNLARWVEEAVEVPPEFNWLGIAQMAETQAWTDTSPQAWARVAIMIFERIAHEKSDVGGGFMISAMRLRAGMIGRFGPVESDYVLDPETIVTWFHSINEAKPEEVANMAVDWHSRPVDEIRELRRIKNRISVTMDLYATGQVAPTSVMLEWAEVYDKLP